MLNVHVLSDSLMITDVLGNYFKLIQYLAKNKSHSQMIPGNWPFHLHYELLFLAVMRKRRIAFCKAKLPTLLSINFRFKNY